MRRFAPVATVTRGGLPESWHHGAAAVVTPEGRLVARVGSEEVATHLRSAAKPYQALPLVLAGGVERFDLSAADLALVCASHQGTPAHVRRVASLLERAGLAAAELGCGAEWPLDRESRRALRSGGGRAGREHHNCSGKHAGMLLACRLLDWPLEGYLDPGHPLQRRILGHVADLCGVPEHAIGLGVDGCGAPTFHLPLRAAARGYAALADPTAAGLDAPVAAAAGRVVEAMTTAPEMVAGPGTFTTRLMAATGGRLLGKEGAESTYSVAVRGPVALGIVVKIADGGERARPGVVLDLLRQMGSLSAAELADLQEFHTPPVVNSTGREVGRIEPDVELEGVGSGTVGSDELEPGDLEVVARAVTRERPAP